MSFKNFVLGVGIFVIYALVLWQGIQAFYPMPEYDDYCDFRARPYLISERGCTFPSELQVELDVCSDIKGEFIYEYDLDGCPISGECDDCKAFYDEARDVYSRNVFIVALIIGVLTFAAGFFVLSVEPVGSALLASGVWALFFGTVINWRNFGSVTRFVLLLVVLIVLIWVALRMNKTGKLFNKKKKKKR